MAQSFEPQFTNQNITTKWKELIKKCGLIFRTKKDKLWQFIAFNCCNSIGADGGGICGGFISTDPQNGQQVEELGSIQLIKYP
ncbi:MAG: hypothetical protein U5N85_19025 [Arcicella sp.]|nr:hypothetical protein [Arcicella sp.]